MVKWIWCARGLSQTNPWTFNDCCVCVWYRTLSSMYLVFASTNASWHCAWGIMICTCADASPTPLRCSRWRPKLVRRKTSDKWRGKKVVVVFGGQGVNNESLFLQFTVCSLCFKKGLSGDDVFFSLDVYLCTILLSGLCSRVRKKSEKMLRRKQRRLLGRPWSWWRDWDRLRNRQSELKMVWRLSECKYFLTLVLFFC